MYSLYSQWPILRASAAAEGMQVLLFLQLLVEAQRRSEEGIGNDPTHSRTRQSITKPLLAFEVVSDGNIQAQLSKTRFRSKRASHSCKLTEILPASVETTWVLLFPLGLNLWEFLNCCSIFRHIGMREQSGLLLRPEKTGRQAATPKQIQALISQPVVVSKHFFGKNSIQSSRKLSPHQPTNILVLYNITPPRLQNRWRNTWCRRK